jgi:hypothetical protein
MAMHTEPVPSLQAHLSKHSIAIQQSAFESTCSPPRCSGGALGPPSAFNTGVNSIDCHMKQSYQPGKRDESDSLVRGCRSGTRLGVTYHSASRVHTLSRPALRSTYRPARALRANVRASAVAEQVRHGQLLPISTLRIESNASGCSQQHTAIPKM